MRAHNCQTADASFLKNVIGLQSQSQDMQHSFRGSEESARRSENNRCSLKGLGSSSQIYFSFTEQHVDTYCQHHTFVCFVVYTMFYILYLIQGDQGDVCSVPVTLQLVLFLT